MKKILTILIMFLLIAGCSKSEETTVEEDSTKEEPISIVTPSGAPSLALLDFADNSDFSIDVVDGADVLQAEFSTGEADMIVAPVNLGVKLSQNTGNYKLASVLTWGNLYLISSEENFESGEVAAFGETAVPGKVINYLSQELANYNFVWFGAVNEVSAAFLTGQYKAAVIAEPYLTMTKSKAENTVYDVIDLQELYKTKSGFDSYPQAALFISTKAIENKKDRIDKNIDELKTSIALYNENNEELITKIEKVDMEKLGFANPDLIKKAYSRIGLNYKNAKDCLDQINAFLKLYDMEASEDIFY